MLALPGRAERVVLQSRSLLDGAVIATSLLYTSWALVLGPMFRAGHTGVLEQAIALAYPLGDVVLVTVVFVVVARIRVGGAYLTQEGSYRTGVPTDAGWFLGHPAAAARAAGPSCTGPS